MNHIYLNHSTYNGTVNIFKQERPIQIKKSSKKSSSRESVSKKPKSPNLLERKKVHPNTIYKLCSSLIDIKKQSQENLSAGKVGGMRSFAQHIPIQDMIIAASDMVSEQHREDGHSGVNPLIN